jgi:uncharacterized membrane protein
MGNKVLNKKWKYNSTRTLLVLAGMFLLGLVIRFYGLGNRGLWYDEVYLWHGVLANSPSPHDGPLVQWLSFLFFALIRSATPFAHHILPAVLGAAAIPLSFLVSTQIGHRNAGFLTAGLLMLSPMAIYYSQEARPYGFFIFLTTLLYSSFLRAHTDHSPGRWLLYGFFTFLCCLTHLLTFQILVAFFFFSVASMSVQLFSDQNRSLLIRRFFHFLITSLIGAGIGTLWVFYRHNPIAIALEGFYPKGLLSYLRTALVSLGPMINYAKSPLGLADLLGGIYVVLFFVGLWYFHKQKKYDLILFFLLAICVPLLINYMTLGEKGFWPWVRYISHLIVPFLVVIACGIEYISRYLKYRTLKIILVAILFLCLSPGIWKWHQNALKSRSSEMIQWTNQIVSMSSKLKGIIIYVKWRNMLIPSKYFIYRKDMLPVYFLSNGKLSRIIGVPSLGNITTIPQSTNHKKVELESGLYALIYNKINPKECQDLSKALKETYFVSCREDQSPRGGILITHIAAKRPK